MRQRPQADRRLRPLARRAASTRRPPGVAIRARKPWRRLRISLLGWYVRFTAPSATETAQIERRPVYRGGVPASQRRPGSRRLAPTSDWKQQGEIDSVTDEI